MPRPRPSRRLAAPLTGALLALLAGGSAVVHVQSERDLHRRVLVPAHDAPAAATFAPTPAAHAALVERGARVVAERGCAGCHGADLGGQVLADDALMGRLATPNLTAGGRGAALTDRAWELALRHGVQGDGTPLRVMPSGEYAAMGDEEVAAVAAYARSLPAVATRPPALRVGPLARLLHVAGRFDLTPAHAIARRQAESAGAGGGGAAHVALAPAGASRR